MMVLLSVIINGFFFFFRATFVRSKETFWVGVKSSTVVYNGTGTTATVAPTVRFTPTSTKT